MYDEILVEPDDDSGEAWSIYGVNRADKDFLCDAYNLLEAVQKAWDWAEVKEVNEIRIVRNFEG